MGEAEVPAYVPEGTRVRELAVLPDMEATKERKEMSAGNTQRLYLVGLSPVDAVRSGQVFTDEKEVQESVKDGFNIYCIDVTLFSSRLKPVKKWV
jgi:hypothetical protein